MRNYFRHNDRTISEAESDAQRREFCKAYYEREKREQEYKESLRRSSGWAPANANHSRSSAATATLTAQDLQQLKVREGSRRTSAQQASGIRRAARRKQSQTGKPAD